MSTVTVDRAKLLRLLEAARAILPPEFKVVTEMHLTGKPHAPSASFQQQRIHATPEEDELREALWHVEQEVKE